MVAHHIVSGVVHVSKIVIPGVERGRGRGVPHGSPNPDHKNAIIHTRFQISDHTLFQTWPLTRNYVIIETFVLGPGKYYMVAQHIVVQHKLNEKCVQRLVSNTHFFLSVLSTPRLSLVSFYVLSSPFPSLLILFCPY